MSYTTKHMTAGLVILKAGGHINISQDADSAWNILHVVHAGGNHDSPFAWVDSTVMLIEHPGKKRPFRVIRSDTLDGEHEPRVSVQKFKGRVSATARFHAVVSDMMTETMPEIASANSEEGSD